MSVCGVVAICNSHLTFKIKINKKLTLNGYRTLKDKLYRAYRFFDSSILLGQNRL